MRFAPLVLCTVLLAALPGPSQAQRPDSVATDTSGVEMERKSPARALLYSLGGTALSVGVGVAFPPLLVGGVIASPSLGHFYAGSAGQAWRGIAIRTGGILVTAGSAAAIAVPGFIAAAVPGHQEISEPPAALTALAVAGMGVVAGSGVYDIATAPRSAREYNRAHGLRAQLVPTVGPAGEQVGLALRVRF